MKKIPYGVSDFRKIKLENGYYIDKTNFIPKLEIMPDYLFFIRPRRFGKSLLLNMLILYYDIASKDEFDILFQDTYILNNKTDNAHRYYILKFDFSTISIKGDLDDNFSYYCNLRIMFFIKKYKLNLEINENYPAHKNLDKLFEYCRYEDINIYIFIDEYDNFINNILMDDEDDYKKIINNKDEAVIYKEFFKLLKSGTSDNNSPLQKMFITGVSPLALFDITSGSNIGTNITNEAMFNDMVGITKKELKILLDYYNIKIKTKEEQAKIDYWYSNYKFSEDIDYVIYNTDMIFYYLKALIIQGKPPKNLVDLNLRTDYSKVRHIISVNHKFNILQTLFGQGYVTALKIKDSFSAFEVRDSNNLISLLYYLGFITIDKYYRGKYYFKIPNHTMKIIVAEYMERSLSENKIFSLDIYEFDNLVQQFAYDGSLEVFFFLSKEIKRNMEDKEDKDIISFIKSIFLVYFTLGSFYAVLSNVKKEDKRVDIKLTKALNIYDEIFEGLIEIKYIPIKFDKNMLDEKVLEAQNSLNNFKEYKKQKAIIIIFSGWNMVYCREYISVKDYNKPVLTNHLEHSDLYL